MWYGQVIEFCGSLYCRVQRNTSEESGKILTGVYSFPEEAEYVLDQINRCGNKPKGATILKHKKLLPIP